MKLKLDENGNVVLQDGKPVYIHDDGKEVAFDAPAAVSKIGSLNAEAKNHRERAETAEKTLKAFDGIDDPQAAIKAVQTVKNLDDKKLVDAGDVERVKEEAIKAVRAEFEPVVTERDGLLSQLHAERIGGGFARSKFVSEKLAIPADMVEARFGANFKMEEGGVVAYDQQGNKIFSRARPGEVADFDEALETLVEQYPNRDHILKGSGAQGSGTKGSDGSGGRTSISREAFAQLSPADQMSKVKAGIQVTE